MKKVLLFIIAVFALSLQYSFAQGKAEATVYMRDGRVIQGILEQSNTGRYRITTADGKISYFTASEVKSIDRKQDGKTEANPGELANPKERIKSGYRGFFELGYAFPPNFGEYAELPRVELTTSHGGQISPHLFLGGGLGVHYYYRMAGYVIPVFANIRVSDYAGDAFFTLKAGFSFGDRRVKGAEAKKDTTVSCVSWGGLYLAPGVGLHYKGINLTWGYSLQMLPLPDSEGNISDNKNIGAISFTVGYSF